ncbi:MAG: amidohydrolase family protein [Acidobacteriota bacterium]
MSDRAETFTRPPAAEPVLLYGGTIVTMDPERRVIPRGEVLISNGRIAAVGRALTAVPGTRLLDVSDSIILPGLIQGHVHLGQTLFRGLAEGRSLLPWLYERILPLEAAYDDDSAYWSTALGAIECLLGGTTTVADIGIYQGFEGHLRAMVDSRLRAITGLCLMDSNAEVPAALIGETDALLDRCAALGHRWHGHNDGRISWSLNPRWILGCSEPLWRGIAELADERGWPVHTHAFEYADEAEAVRQATGHSELDFFAKTGVLDTELRIAHGVQLDAEDRLRLAGHGAAVIHCPGANLKLGSEIADLLAMRDSGIPVAVSCDGPPCNNHLDALEETRLAARLQMLQHGPGAVSGWDALSWVTIGAARALGLDQTLGSIEVGKAADLAVLGMDATLWASSYADPHDVVAYSAGRRHISHVFVAGEQLVEDGRLVHADVDRVQSEAHRAAKALWRRSALG